MFSSRTELLEIIVEDGVSSAQKCEANKLLGLMQSFDFVLTLHLMKVILGITDELSKALQRKDQDIVNAMTLVKISKQRLQMKKDEIYPQDFFVVKIEALDDQLETYILDMHPRKEFIGLKGIGALA
ncbi:hypothetical protein PTKIN_Ptkin05aG0109900 [Pterospermum kingtungense]